MSLGTAAGGWRIMKTMGQEGRQAGPGPWLRRGDDGGHDHPGRGAFRDARLDDSRDLDAIMGVGSSDRPNAVHWEWRAASSRPGSLRSHAPPSSRRASSKCCGYCPGRSARSCTCSASDRASPARRRGQFIPGPRRPSPQPQAASVGLGPPQHVAHAAHRLEVDRVGRIGLDLGPQQWTCTSTVRVSPA